MVTRISLSLLAVLLLPAAALAQRLEPGYVVLSPGDTLRGQVENNAWDEPPTEIRFQTDPASGVVTYPVRRVLAAGLSQGRHFRRQVLPIDYAATVNPHQLPQGFTSAQRQDTVLANVLLDGPATLLGLELGTTKHFFVRREQQSFLELTERLYQVTRDGRQQIVDGNTYRTQLQQYFGDCAAVVDALPRTPFTAAALVSLLQQYNLACSTARQAGRVALPPKAVSRFKLVAGPTLGLRYNSVRLRTDAARGLEAQTLDGVQMDGVPHPQFGAFLDLLFGGRRFALHSALTHSSFGSTTGLASPDGQSQWAGQLDWRGSMTTIELGIRRLNPIGQHLYLLLGTGLTLPIVQVSAAQLRYGTSGYSRPVAGGQVPTVAPSPFAEPFQDARLALPYLEAGLRRDRLTLMLYVRRYNKQTNNDPLVVAGVNPTSGYYNTYRYTARATSVALTLGYQLTSTTE